MARDPNCPPVQAPQTAFDFRSPATCAEMLQGLLKAYYGAISGTQRVTVRYKERWSEYSKANAELLRQEYCSLYRQCPYAVTAGLPDLSAQSRVLRGRPARPAFFFPRA